MLGSMKSRMTHLRFSARDADSCLAYAPVVSDSVESCCPVAGFCRLLESAAGAVPDYVAGRNRLDAAGRRTAAGALARTGCVRFCSSPGRRSNFPIASAHDRGVCRCCDGARSLVGGVLCSVDSAGAVARYDSIDSQLRARDSGCDVRLLRCLLP